ncbi:hypothetical protein D3C76_1331430 [compost metagenome]
MMLRPHSRKPITSAWFPEPSMLGNRKAKAIISRVMTIMVLRRPKASASRPAIGTITPKPITATISIHRKLLRE